MYAEKSNKEHEIIQRILKRLVSENIYEKKCGKRVHVHKELETFIREIKYFDVWENNVWMQEYFILFLIILISNFSNCDNWLIYQFTDFSGFKN